jgi:hypothetical protein
MRMARGRLLLALPALVAGLMVSPSAPPASAAGYAANPSNPLAARPWGVYTGKSDGVYPAYQAAAGSDRALLAKVALRPRAIWFGPWTPAAQIAAKVRDYVTRTQAGNPETVVPLAVFRLWPYSESGKSHPLSAADLAGYRSWIDQLARGIGGSRVAIVLEPDLAVALGGWRPAVRMSLASYAARVLGALPHAAVYLDGSDSDWLPVAQAAAMLRAAGVRYVRGFALGATHYSGTAANIEYGSKVVAALAAAGVRGKHFVVDTADNGRPFTWSQYWAKHPQGDFDNAEPCRTRTETRCDTLGIPPTWRVADPAWHLGTRINRLAKRHADGYLWFGRPWLVRQSSPFSLARTLQVAATTPY